MRYLLPTKCLCVKVTKKILPTKLLSVCGWMRQLIPMKLLSVREGKGYLTYRV
jgi:hypothetical protein